MDQGSMYILSYPNSPPPLAWLGVYRKRVLRLRDRFVPWQMRHFYYRYESPVYLSTRCSLAFVVGRVLTLLLHTFSVLLGYPIVLPVDVLQSMTLFIPELQAVSRRITLPHGKVLYHAAQPAPEVMLLVEGYGRLCMEQEDGKCLTVGLVAPGDLFGEEALLDVPERESTFEAVLNSQIDAIAKEDFIRTMNANPSLMWSFTEHLSQRLLGQQHQMVRLAFEPVEQRLAWLLLQLAAAKGNAESSEPTIAIYHKDLAAVLGIWRETITATLNLWAKNGLITQSPGHIILKDIPRLQSMAEKNSSA